MQDRSGAEWAWRRAGLVQQGEASVAGEEAGVHARVSELWEAASASVSAASTSTSSLQQPAAAQAALKFSTFLRQRKLHTCMQCGKKVGALDDPLWPRFSWSVSVSAVSWTNSSGWIMSVGFLYLRFTHI